MPEQNEPIVVVIEIADNVVIGTTANRRNVIVRVVDYDWPADEASHYADGDEDNTCEVSEEIATFDEKKVDLDSWLTPVTEE